MKQRHEYDGRSSVRDMLLLKRFRKSSSVIVNHNNEQNRDDDDDNDNNNNNSNHQTTRSVDGTNKKKKKKNKQASKHHHHHHPHHHLNNDHHRRCNTMYYEDNIITINAFAGFDPEVIHIEPKDIQQYPLHTACQYDNHDNAMLLLRLFPEAAKQKNIDGDYPLHIACRYRRPEAFVMKLLEIYAEAAMQPSSFVEGYALHLACHYHPSEAVIRKLLELHPHALHIPGENSMYPIHHALCVGQPLEINKLMIEKDPTILQQVDEYGRTPLHVACWRNRNSTVEYMFQHHHHNNNNNNADHTIPINYCNVRGDSPVHVACRFNTGTILEMLLQHPNVDVTIKNLDGDYPLQIACRYGQHEMYVLKILELFPDAVLHKSSFSDRHVMHLACQSVKSEAVIRKLIELHPTSLREKDCYSIYPIHHAIHHGQSLGAIKLMIEAEPSVVQQIDGPAGRTALHYACWKNRTTLVQYMLQQRTLHHPLLLVNAMNHQGETPLHIAGRYGRDVIMAMLLQHHDIDVNVIDKLGNSFLHNILIYQGGDKCLRIMPLLLRHHPDHIDILHHKNRYHETPNDLFKKRIHELQQHLDHPNNRHDDARIRTLLSSYQEGYRIYQELVWRRRCWSYHYISLTFMDKIQEV